MVTWRSNPAARARALSAGCPNPLNAIKYGEPYFWSRRIAVATALPSIWPGSPMSHTTISGWKLMAFVRACSPSAATSTSWPATSRTLRRLSAKSQLSSTTRIR